MRDALKTRRAFAVWAAAAAALCVLALSALSSSRGGPLAQDAQAQATPAPYESQSRKPERDVNEVAKEENIRPPVVNVKPLEDVLAEAGELIKQGRLGPDARVDVTAKGERNEDGSLKPETVVLNWTTSGDEAAATLAQRFVSALSQSRLFYVLEGAKDVTVRVSLDETNAIFSVAADVSSEGRARQLADGYGAMLLLASKTKEGTHEAELYRSVKVSSDGRRFAFTFEMTKENLGRIIGDVSAKRAARAND